MVGWKTMKGLLQKTENLNMTLIFLVKWWTEELEVFDFFFFLTLLMSQATQS